MRKSVTILTLIVFSFLLLECSEKTGIFFPETNLKLVYPSDGLICLDNKIDFNWTDKSSTQENSKEY